MLKCEYHFHIVIYFVFLYTNFILMCYFGNKILCNFIHTKSQLFQQTPLWVNKQPQYWFFIEFNGNAEKPERDSRGRDDLDAYAGGLANGGLGVELKEGSLYPTVSLYRPIIIKTSRCGFCNSVS